MSRPEFSLLPDDGKDGCDLAPAEVAQIAEDIGKNALALARQAREAGLSSVGFLLESVALEAGSQAAAQRWSADATKP
jgi:hypothetical protein